jgi:hypothetical protein
MSRQVLTSPRGLAVASSVVIGMAAALLGAAPVSAQRPVLGKTQSGAHVVVHYSVTPDPNGITDEAAGRLVAAAEQAWGVIVDQWGWTPLPDGTLGGDARLDYYVAALPAGVGAVTRRPSGQRAAPAYIVISRDRAGDLLTIAHEMLHAGQDAIAATAETWLQEGTAEWAGRTVAGVPQDVLFDPAIPLDCATPGPCLGGYRTQGFFKYLAGLFGPGVIRAIFTQWRYVPGGPPPAASAINAALVAAGSSLARAFGEFSAAYAAARPKPVGTITIGTQAAPAPVRIPVNHLAAKHLALKAGGAAPCPSTTLTITTRVPSGAAAVPSVVVPGGGPPVMLHGAPFASAQIPWNTCTGRATLVLPNASATADNLAFDVTAKVAGTPVPPTPAATAAPQLQAAGSAWPSPAGRFTVSVRCRATRAGGCSGTVALVARVKGRLTALASQRWTAPTNAAVSVRLQLGDRERRIVAAARQIRLDVVARDRGTRSTTVRRVLSHPID